MRGYTVVDAATVISTHLSEVIKNNMADLLSYGEVQKLVRELPKEQGDIVKDLVPSITLSTFSVFSRCCSASAFRSAISAPSSKASPKASRARAIPPSVDMCAPGSPARFAPCIFHQGYLPLIALSAKWEQTFAESIVGEGDDRQLAMQPSKLSEFITIVRERFEEAARGGEAPVLVTSSNIRPFVRWIVERFRAQTPVLSQSEIHPRVRLKTVGSI